jgi:hypothetical protein
MKSITKKSSLLSLLLACNGTSFAKSKARKEIPGGLNGGEEKTVLQPF